MRTGEQKMRCERVSILLETVCVLERRFAYIEEREWLV
jgi:hypothetical protein